MNVLGIAYLDCLSASCLVQDGTVVAAAHEERFSRNLGETGLPSRSVEFCLTQRKVSEEEVDAVVYYQKPLLKMEQLLFSHFRRWPHSLSEFLETRANRFVDRLKTSSNLHKILSSTTPVYFVQHQESMAAGAFFCSAYRRATVVVLDRDAAGAWASVWLGENNSLTPVSRLRLSGAQPVNGPALIEQAIKITGEHQTCVSDGDGMAAAGAALFYYHQILGGLADAGRNKPPFLWGPGYEQIEINQYLNRAGIPYTLLEDKTLSKRVARLIADGAAVGWFQGRMEFTGHSCGNRALLMKSKKAHGRDIEYPSISRNDNPLFFDLITEIAAAGIHTSPHHGPLQPLNGPMACTPQNGFQSFAELGLDAIAIGNALIERKDIPYLSHHR